MRFKLIVALVEDELSDQILQAARDAGATGATVINNARGEGLKKAKGILQALTLVDYLMIGKHHHLHQMLN